jgi:hypothetical protein
MWIYSTNTCGSAPSGGPVVRSRSRFPANSDIDRLSAALAEGAHRALTAKR